MSLKRAGNACFDESSRVTHRSNKLMVPGLFQKALKDLRVILSRLNHKLTHLKFRYRQFLVYVSEFHSEDFRAIFIPPPNGFLFSFRNKMNTAGGFSSHE